MFLCQWEGKAAGTNKRLDTNRKGVMYKGKEYTAFQWSLVAEMMVSNRRKKIMLTPVYARIIFRVSKARDIDSLIKPVLDCLEKAQVIKNDNLVVRLFVEKVIKAKGELDSIRIFVDDLNLSNIDVSIEVKKK